MPYLAGLLSNMLDRPVVDMTGVIGVYDVDLVWWADDAPDAGLSSVFTALQETLGLRLEARKTPVDLYVIDRIDRAPTEN